MTIITPPSFQVPKTNQSKQKFDPPQVAEASQDETDLRKLIHEVFAASECGQSLLKKLHELYVDISTFPSHPNQIAQFGSTEAYCGFRSGQSNVIKWIEFQIQSCKEGN